MKKLSNLEIKSASVDGPRIAIVILNWRRPKLTLACFESVMALEYNNFDIWICDNDSQDGSLQIIAQGVKEKLLAINERRVTARKNLFKFSTNIGKENPKAIENGAQLVAVISTTRNGGYAYGNNAAIRQANEVRKPEFFWILNNDTLVDCAAAERLVETMKNDETIGILGSLVLYLNRKQVVQTLGGGAFLPWRARCEQIGTGLAVTALPPKSEIEKNLDYINGASAFIRTKLVDTIGLMDERYFLYFEEIDWATRARAAGFHLAYCETAIVYHQVGAASGTSDEGPPSSHSAYHAERSKFIFLRTHYPFVILIAIPILLRKVLQQVRMKRYALAKAMLRGALGMKFRD